MPRRTATPDRVIFACVHNAGRSQMAAAWFAALADPERATAISAGTDPAARAHPEVLASLAEVGLDGAVTAPRRLTRDLAEGAALLVTMGCGDACPVLPGVEVRDWPLPDPKGLAPDAVRAIREAIRSRVEALLAERGWGRGTDRGPDREPSRIR